VKSGTMEKPRTWPTRVRTFAEMVMVGVIANAVWAGIVWEVSRLLSQ